ncbi:MAG: hypothetical protein EPN86_03990 [Nanoarchaeota archaeon]|nr:MAG: hypothetical protein EPN86_03990 [Nanoarchaeota archaeon]
MTNDLMTIIKEHAAQGAVVYGIVAVGQAVFTDYTLIDSLTATAPLVGGLSVAALSDPAKYVVENVKGFFSHNSLVDKVDKMAGGYK